MTDLDLRGVTNRFGSTTAVDSLDLHIPHGALAVVVGPSGCGKSILLNMLAVGAEAVGWRVILHVEIGRTLGELDALLGRGPRGRSLQPSASRPAHERSAGSSWAYLGAGRSARNDSSTWATPSCAAGGATYGAAASASR